MREIMYCQSSGSNILFCSWEFLLIFTGFVDLLNLLQLGGRYSEGKGSAVSDHQI